MTPEQNTRGRADHTAENTGTQSINRILSFCRLNAFLFWIVSLAYLFTLFPLQLPNPNFLAQTLAWLFLLCAASGYLGLIAFLPAMLAYPLCKLKFPDHLISSLSVFGAYSLLLLLISDVWIFYTYRFHINSVFLRFFFSAQAKEILHLSWLEWLLILGLAIIALMTELCLWKISKYFCKKIKAFLIFIIFNLLFSYYLFLLGASISPNLSINKQAYALPFYEETLSKILPFENGLQRFINLQAGSFTQIAQPNHLLNYPLHPLIFHTPHQPLNLVIIVIDTWRFDSLNASVTPHLNQFAQQAWRFTNHWSGGNCTQPGIFSLFYGLPENYWASTIAQHKSPVLMNALLKNHYQVGVFASATLLSPPFFENVFSQIKDLNLSTSGDTPFERDKKITQEFESFLINRSPRHPFFTFLFYDSAHSYCSPGDPIQKFQPSIAVCNHLLLNKNSDPTPYFNRYRNALYFVDEQIQAVLYSLQQKNLLKNTVVLITGDHGNEFNDLHQGYWEHAGNFSRFQVQTPLILYWPQQTPKVFQSQTSHYDLASTLMQGLLGCQNAPIDYSIGNPLWKKVTPHYLIAYSYIDFAMIEPTQITAVLPTGSMQITDINYRSLSNTSLSLETFRGVWKDLTRYYEHTTTPSN